MNKLKVEYIKGVIDTLVVFGLFKFYIWLAIDIIQKI